MKIRIYIPRLPGRFGACQEVNFRDRRCLFYERKGLIWYISKAFVGPILLFSNIPWRFVFMKRLLIILGVVGAWTQIGAAKQLSVSIDNQGETTEAHARGATITAHLMLPSEYKKEFYPLPGASQGYEYTDLNAEHIYPILFSCTNNSKRALAFTVPHLNFASTEILTLERLQSRIDTTQMVAGCMTVLFFPIGLLMIYCNLKLQQFTRLIANYGLPSEEVTVQPGETCSAVLFAKLDPVKTSDNKAVTQTLPSSFDVVMEYTTA